MDRLKTLLDKTYDFQAEIINGSEVDGDSFPHFVGEDADGKIFILVTPFEDESQRKLVLMAVRQKFKEHGIVRYAMASETWSVTKRVEDIADDEPLPYEHPDREDSLLVFAVDKAGNVLSRNARIIVADDRKRHLEPIDMKGASVTGMMVDLLKGLDDEDVC